jgi:heme-degrading monooxygenase HmoA
MTAILINPFEVPKGKEEEALAFWNRVADYMRKQPGFASTRLHRAVVP